MKFIRNMVLLAVTFYFPFSVLAAPKALPPHNVPGGVEFQYYAPEAEIVYLAGDFNNWAENDGGKVTSRNYAMDKKDNGFWTKVIQVDAGRHSFKYVVNGAQWFPDPNILEKDKDNNSIFTVNKEGKIYYAERNASLAPGRVRNGVLFQYQNPQAKVVYLAGDFNEWGLNDGGLVSDPKFLMEGPDKKGIFKKIVPVAPGKHSFRYVVDGDQWIADPNVPDKDPDGNSSFTLP